MCTNHTFVEEQEPNGRLILGPCIECGMPALEALEACKKLLVETEKRITSVNYTYKGDAMFMMKLACRIKEVIQ